MAPQSRPQVVILGAGFGGLWAAKALRKAPVDVVIIDRHNYHTFFPLLYQVAAAELAPGDIAHPVRKITRRQGNARFVLANAIGIDQTDRALLTDRGRVRYDYLIVAIGSTTQFFDVPGAADNSYQLRTLEHGVALRNHILERFEAADLDPPATANSALTFVVVGGGPTGVEFSGALQELVNGPIAKDHPRLDPAGIRVVLIEAGARLLSVYPERLSRYAAKRLRHMGVEVMLATKVAAVETDGVQLESGERIPASTVVWTAGVGGPVDLARWSLAVEGDGRATVTPELNLATDERIFVVGDSSQPAATASPPVAQNATQQGTLAAKNVLRLIAGDPLKPYSYKDLGNMAVIGRNAAIVHLFGRIGFKGYPAWLMWLALHLAKLIGFRNRVAALLSWSGDYLFRDRVARVITSERKS